MSKSFWFACCIGIAILFIIPEPIIGFWIVLGLFLCALFERFGEKK
jgi:hypothetical protein